jgi:meiotic recombination protein SPO11
MAHVKSLTQQMAEGAGVDLTRSLISLGYRGVREVAELPPLSVQRRIEDIVLHVARSILDGHSFAYAVPNRGSANQMYIPELDRIVLKNKLSVRPFIGTSTVRKTAIMTRVMQLVHEVLHKNIHTTKRDLFYTDVKLFKSQDESNAVLDDIACMAGCTRTSLHVVASEKGVVVGKLRFKGAFYAPPPFALHTCTPYSSRQAILH